MYSDPSVGSQPVVTIATSTAAATTPPRIGQPPATLRNPIW